MTDLAAWLSEPEGERLEFKEARRNYHFEKLVDYCVALANEGGGRIVLGVSDRRPRRIVGTQAFAEPGRTVAGLMERLPLRIGWTELRPVEGRVLVFDVPGRPVGMPIEQNGRYLARSGDELRALAPEELRRIFAEGCVDYSAELHPQAGIADLDPGALERFRRMWRKKSGNSALAKLSYEQLLADAELVLDGRVTLAALILMGTEAALGRFLPQAELVFEFRATDHAIAHQHRVEYRRGFLSFLEDLWATINLRNDVLHLEDGWFIHDIPVFNELVIREAVLNAVTHRDYRLPGSVFVRQTPRRLEIVSPGGFPPGITVDNILHRQSPRNRRIAEACARCGLVERSGQGANRMFEESIREGKPRPDFNGTDDHQVSLALLGEVQNPQFLRFLEKVAAERQLAFSIEDLFVLDALQRQEPIPAGLKAPLRRLTEHGVVERIGRGRGVRFVLSRRFYSFLGRKGAYTREKGLDRNTRKALLVQHIETAGREGARLQDLQDVLRDQSRAQIQTLLRELRSDGQVVVSGLTRGARWFPAIRPLQ